MPLQGKQHYGMERKSRTTDKMPLRVNRRYKGRLAAPDRAGGDAVDLACEVEYTDRMEVKLTPELEAKLDGIAAQQGRDAQSLVKEAVERLVEYDEWFVREVEKGLEQIEHGEVLGHEEVGARLEKLLNEKQSKP